MEILLAISLVVGLVLILIVITLLNNKIKVDPKFQQSKKDCHSCKLTECQLHPEFYLQDDKEDK